MGGIFPLLLLQLNACDEALLDQQADHSIEFRADSVNCPKQYLVGFDRGESLAMVGLVHLLDDLRQDSPKDLLLSGERRVCHPSRLVTGTPNSPAGRWRHAARSSSSLRIRNP